MQATNDLFADEQEPNASRSPTQALVEKVESIGNRAKAKRKLQVGGIATETQSILNNLQSDFFVADLVDVSFKSDIQSMDLPIFSLSTKKDTDIFEWESPDKRRWLKVAPSAFGRASMLDKDVLIFLASQTTAALNEGRAISKTIRFTAYEFLRVTNRDTSGRGYKSLLDALARLRGTTFKIGDSNDSRGRVFGLIESANIETNENGRQAHVEVVVSQTFLDSMINHQVLTINKDYFQLTGLLERRLYEIARKHTGKQGCWEIGLENLFSKTGSGRELKKFKFELKRIIKEDILPDYRMSLQGDKVIFYDKDPSRVAKRLGKSTTLTD